MMTRKDYELIATAIGRARVTNQEMPTAQLAMAADKTLTTLVAILVSDLAAINPNFKRDTFVRACGF